VVLKQIPHEPGAVLHEDYDICLERILSTRPDCSSIPDGPGPFITGRDIPQYWSRKDGDTLYIFFPNPKSGKPGFPLNYGQSFNTKTFKTDVTVNFEEESYDLKFLFKPYQSLLYKLQNGMAEQIDIEFIPSTPTTRERPENYEAPWLVK